MDDRMHFVHIMLCETSLFWSPKACNCQCALFHSRWGQWKGRNKVERSHMIDADSRSLKMTNYSENPIDSWRLEWTWCYSFEWYCFWNQKEANGDHWIKEQDKTDSDLRPFMMNWIISCISIILSIKDDGSFRSPISSE